MIKSPPPDYNFPNFPNAETRDQTNPLRTGLEKPVGYNAPLSVPFQNTNPNPYAVAGSVVPGQQPFGMGFDYAQFPQPVDIVHRNIVLTLDEPMLYRSGLSAPRHESPTQRIFAPSPTTPSTNAVRFIDGRKGDVYGG